MNIIINRKRILLSIIIIAAALVFLSIMGQVSRYFLGHGQLLGFIDMFNLEVEYNVPTVFQSFMILFSAIIIFFILKFTKVKEMRSRHYWITLFILFLLAGLDELIQIHEKWKIIIVKITKTELGGLFNFEWTIIGIIVVSLLIIYFAFFLLKIDKKTRLLFILSAFLYVFGALAMEMLDGLYVYNFGPTFTYQLLQTLEEIMEMAGIITFIWTLLRYLKQEITATNLEINFK